MHSRHLKNKTAYLQDSRDGSARCLRFHLKRSKAFGISFFPDVFCLLMIHHCKYEEEQRHNDNCHDRRMRDMRIAVDEIFVAQDLLHPVPNETCDDVVVKERHSEKRRS